MKITADIDVDIDGASKLLAVHYGYSLEDIALMSKEEIAIAAVARGYATTINGKPSTQIVKDFGDIVNARKCR